jgi:phosphomannomutase/phosphoglucomutase
MAEKEKKLSELVKEVPSYYLIKTKVKCENNKEIIEKLKNKVEGEKIDYTDGIKVYLKDGWVLMRPSGTEPIIRIYAEGKDEKAARKIADRYKKMIEKELGRD